MRLAAPVRPLLRDGRYLRIWLIGWMVGIVRWLELLAYGIFAYEVTGSPSLVALIALIRFVPLALLGVLVGAVADQVNPRRLLVLGLLAIGGVLAVMLGLSEHGSLAYWHIALATFASGAFWTAEQTFRRKIIGEIAGPGRLAQAMSFDYATSNGTRMIGPFVGGWLYEQTGMSGVFVLAIGLYAIATLLALRIAPSSDEIPAGFRPGAAVTGARDALSRALRDNDVTAIMAGTVIFNIWGFPFVAMLPVIGAETLSLTPAMIGYISAIEGATGLIFAFIVGILAQPWMYRRLYLFGIAGHLASVAVIGLSGDILMVSVGLALAGFFTAGFAGMQSTLIYTVAPPEMRGRYLGLISICIGAGLIGFANVGLTAELVGASNALWIIAAQGAVATLALAFWWRAFRAEAGLG